MKINLFKKIVLCLKKTALFLLKLIQLNDFNANFF